MPGEPKIRSKWAILIVDDEFGVRESFRMALKPSYEVHTASGGEEALNILKEQKIDLITLDLNMPELSGIETLREIRKIDRQVPVIIITGYGTREVEEEARLYGARAFISKPFNISRLITLIDAILGERLE
jgi:two-component system response regulator (stage 0 sporulation protein F)